MKKEAYNMRLRLEYLDKDKPCEPGTEAAGFGSLDIEVAGSHIYGGRMTPDGSYTLPRPCVILVHGFPGNARNDDLGQALRRVGCVVLVPHHRGSWGSEGTYSFSNCIEDTVCIAKYAHGREFCLEYNVDPDSIFLCGHSMGGSTALQALRRLPWLCGAIMMTPYDPTFSIRKGHPEEFRELLDDCRVLAGDGPEALFKEAEAHLDEYNFNLAFDDVKDRNLCIIEGEYDEVAPPAMAEPLWTQLSVHRTKAVQRLVRLPSDHCLSDVRFAAARCLGEFINQAMAEKL